MPSFFLALPSSEVACGSIRVGKSIKGSRYLLHPFFRVGLVLTLFKAKRSIGSPFLINRLVDLALPLLLLFSAAMQRPPAQLLSWPSLHLTEEETRGPAILVILSVLLGVVTLLVGVRIYTRCRITHGFGSDDVLILLAFVSLLHDKHMQNTYI